jgi:hypothetical protein
MADETVIITSPGLVTWGSGTFGDGSYGGQELSLGLLQGTATTSIDVAVGVTGTQLVIISPATKTSGIQNVSGTSDNILFAFRPNEASKIQYVGAGWNVVGQPTFIVTAVSLDPNDQYTGTITITGGTFISGATYSFESPNVTLDIGAEPIVQGTQINLIVTSVVASIPETVTLVGSQINLDEGSVTTDFQPDAGWGVYGYGIVPWGEGPDVIATVTGIRLNTFVHPVDTNADGNESVNVDEDDDIVIYLNSVTTSANANVDITGSQINLITGSVAIVGNASVNVTGSQRNIEISSVTTTAGASVNVTGTQINIVTGQAIEVITADVFPTGTRINVAEGLAGAVITGDANVSVTGTRINVAEGLAGVQIKGDANVTVTGRQLNITIGNEDISADANVNVTGSRINLSAGQLTYAAGYDVTGSRINIAIGNETTSANANVNVTGIRLNISTGSANVTAWAEVQTGANNIWTPVDLAA